MKICAHLEDWELIQPFRISGNEWITSPTLVVQVAEDGCVGRGQVQEIGAAARRLDHGIGSEREVAVEATS